MTNTKHTLFLDSIGRTILGELVSTQNNVLKVKNPAMIVVQQTQTQQLQVQLIPLFFQEFVDPVTRTDGSVFEYLMSNITKIDLNLDEKIITHYDRVFNPSSIITPNNNAPVIKLFED